MKMHKIRAVALAAALGLTVRSARTCDVAFPYRMGAGFQGELARNIFNAVVEPSLINVTNPPAYYGCAVVVDTATNSVRNMLAGDTALTSIYGIAMRPFPTQQAQSGNNWGQIALGASVAPPTVGVIDVIREGYALVKLNNGVTATKKGAVYVWVAASSGNHVQGGFEASATGGSTIAITNAWWNGPADANGIAELFITAVN